MMSVTHTTVAVSLGLLALRDPSLPTLGLLILGSQLPDIDNTKSYVGRVVWPLARYIEDRWPHRSITHSLVITIILAIIGYFALPLKYNWVALPLGHLSAILTDTLTPEGVQLFWPARVWAVFGSNPNKRIRTGSKAELAFLFVWVIIGLIAFSVIDVSDLRSSVSSLLGGKNSVIETIEKNPTNHIYGVITGYWTLDRVPIKDEKFLILSSSPLILANKDGIYSESQIFISRLTPLVGASGNVELKQLTFNDTPLSLPATNKVGFLSGELVLDTEDLTINLPVKWLAVIDIGQNRIKLTYCPTSIATKLLTDRDLTGQLALKLMSNPYE